MNNNISIRLFCEVTLTVGERINLETEQSHYLKNVMRCKIGEKFLFLTIIPANTKQRSFIFTNVLSILKFWKKLNLDVYLEMFG